MKESKDEDWPDEMDFKVERWQRASEKRIILREINQTNKFNQNQEIFLDQEEEEYRFANSLIPEEPSKLSKYGLKTSLIIVKGFLSRKNL